MHTATVPKGMRPVAATLGFGFGFGFGFGLGLVAVSYTHLTLPTIE